MQTRWLSILLFVLVLATRIVADDWPTWRHDGARSASTSEELADQLHLQWWREYPPLKPAWSEDPRLYFDADYEPIVMGQTMFFGSSRNDSVTAVDITTGKERWRFFAEGPVRFAPVASRGRVYFGADDGYFYCLDAETGDLVWQHQAAPGGRKVLGNERLISVWPVRGGPVLADGKIYFTVGVWPFEGTFLYALDEETGQPVSPVKGEQRERTGSTVANANPAEITIVNLKDNSPQGYLAVSSEGLLMPCGRSVAACFHWGSGELVNYDYSTHATTNYHVCTSGPWLFHGLISYDMATGETSPIRVRRPVLTDHTMYVGQEGNVAIYDLNNRKRTVDRQGAEIDKPELTLQSSLTVDIGSGPARDSVEYEQWIKEHPLCVDLKAGNRLYGHQQDTIFAVDLGAADHQPPKVLWTKRIEGTVASMIAANKKLFVVTREGRIYCFGQSSVDPTTFPWRPRYWPALGKTANSKASRVLSQVHVRDGYCVVLGIDDGSLIDRLVRETSFRIIGVDADANVIDRLRRRLDKSGWYGKRVTLHVGDPLAFQFPPYLANLVVSEDWQKTGENSLAKNASQLFEILRPYGGKLVMDASLGGGSDLAERLTASELPRAEVQRQGDNVMIGREGALPGAANWTHEYGNPGNTLMSSDQRVRAPLGVLWFGGPSGDTNLFYNRHYWGPSLLVVDGRMFIQGPGKLAAVDIYTGRMLWKIALDHNESYNPGRRGNDFEGVLAGFHLAAVSDSLYVVLGNNCLRLDPASGKELARFQVSGGAGEWGRVRIYNDLLIASVFRDTEAHGQLPVELVSLDRFSGTVRWSKKAKMSFPVVALGHDIVFCFDGVLEKLSRDSERRGLVPKSPPSRQLRAWDVETGEEIWQNETDMIATWMGYSQSRDVLLVSNKNGIAALQGCSGEDLWEKEAEGLGFLGHPENLWDKVIIWNDRIIDQRGPGRSYDLKTGEAVTRKHPITGAELDWEFTRQGHHCNYAVANPHLLTFRSGSAGFCDIETAQTSRLLGFRSGCRNSLIPAGGVLNAPNFAHGCVCGYSLFTSMGLVHLPEVEMWNYSALSDDNRSLKRVGINFGAPGDRMAKNGVLWLDYPNVGGSSPDVPVEITVDAPRWFQLHSSFMTGDGTRWVSASGIEGAGSFKIGLLGDSSSQEEPNEQSYTVGLHFVEPTATAPRKRVFDVDIEGQTVLINLDIFEETGGRHRTLVKRFEHVRPGAELEIAMRPSVGHPVIAGVEIIAEEEQ